MLKEMLFYFVSTLKLEFGLSAAAVRVRGGVGKAIKGKRKGKYVLNNK